MLPSFRKEKRARELRPLLYQATIPVDAADHGTLAGLGDDDHAQYVHLSAGRTIQAQHSFSPTVAQAPFVLGVNAQGQKVTGLNADTVDGYEGHAPVTVGNTGLSLAGQQLSLALAGVSGLAISGGLMLADSVAGAGLTISGKVLAVGAGNGLTAAADAVNVGAGDGIDVAADSVAVDVTDFIDTAYGLTENANDIRISLYTNSGLNFVGGQLALGLPTTISSTQTNNVTGASHAHALSIFDVTAPTTIQPDASGAAGASSNAARRDHTHGIVAAAPSTTLTPDTTNAEGTATSFARSDHTHALDTSADVGTTPAKKILRSTDTGGLTLATLTVRGNLEVLNNGDFTVGANVLFVDESQTNVGINCAPDQQFDLDIAGNLRAQGWIVGKHAIQIADAEHIWHFDGPQPYETDFTGTLLSHRALNAETETNISFFRGKFGKALISAEATTNLIRDPGASATTYWAGINGATVSLELLKSWVGDTCIKVVADPAQSSSGVSHNTATGLGGSGATYSVQARVYIDPSSAVSVAVWWRFWYTDASYDNLPSSVITTEGEWVDVFLTQTADAGKTLNYIQLMARTSNAGAATFWVDGWQVEQKAYPTPFCYGDMPGAVWDGTAYASSSTRTAQQLRYAPLTPPEAFTIGIWFKPIMLPEETTVNSRLLDWRYDSSNVYIIGYNASSNAVYAQYISAGGSYLGTTASPLTRNTWHFVTVTFDGSTHTLYLDGVYKASGTVTVPFAVKPVNLYIGTAAGYVSPTNAYIDDTWYTSSAMDADEIRAIYESDAPVFAETSTFSFKTPSAIPIWADHEGLWMRDEDGDPVFGWSGVDGKSWGGVTLDQGDNLIGIYGTSQGGWQRWDRSDAKFTLGYSDVTVWEFDSGGATLAGVLDIGTSGGIYQGTGTFASPTSGIKLWNDTGQGKLEAWNSGSLRSRLSYEGLHLRNVVGTLDFRSGTTLQVVEGQIYHDGSKLYLISGSTDVALIHVDDSLDRITFGVNGSLADYMEYDGGAAENRWTFQGAIRTGSGNPYFKIGAFTSAGDAASNGYVSVVIGGVTYKLSTRA